MNESVCIRSQIRCGRCNQLVASFHRHDFRSCRCGGVAIDGGLDYLRIVGDRWTDESISMPKDTSREDRVLSLGVLCAMPYDEAVTVEDVGLAMAEQHLTKGWFPDPPSSEIVRALQLLVPLGYVREDRGSPEGRYRRTVHLAEWPEFQA